MLAWPEKSCRSDGYALKLHQGKRVRGIHVHVTQFGDGAGRGGRQREGASGGRGPYIEKVLVSRLKRDATRREHMPSQHAMPGRLEQQGVHAQRTIGVRVGGCWIITGVPHTYQGPGYSAQGPDTSAIAGGVGVRNKYQM
jgi:hypothetical protein